MDPSQRLILVELEDRVEEIFSAIAELRESVGDGKATRHLLESIFRIVHNLKAASLASGLDGLSEVAHQFENLLHALRTGRTRLDDELLRAFDDTSDALFSSLNPQDPVDNQTRAALFDRLTRLSDAVTLRRRAEVEIVLNALPVEIWHSLSEPEKHRLEESVGEGASLYLVATQFDVADFDQQFQNLKDRLIVTGEVISMAPKVDNDRPDKIDFRIVYTREADIEHIKKDLASIPDVTVSELAGSSTEPPLTTCDDKSAGELLPGPTGPTNLIRINLDDLDRLIAATHKLFRVTTNGFDRAIENLPGHSIQPELSAVAGRVSNSLMELAAELVNLRMVSIDRVLQRALRSGRAAALVTGKEIDFVVSGRNLLLDKSLSEAIADPLIHLVRNAVDHGIEDVERRVKLGKSRRGNVRIEATTLQGQTRITVTDDGRGVDPEVVAYEGKRLGLVKKDALLSVDQSVRLLFRPGFSTATTVSETSGRGVGLDVVETAVEEVGGAVAVASKPGAGSSFQIRLPVTFSLLDVVMVSVGPMRYLLDASRVITSRMVDSEEFRNVGRADQLGTSVKTSESSEHFRIDNVLLPLLHLGELLGRGSTEVEEGKRVGLLLCKIMDHSSGKTDSVGRVLLLVDSVLATQQVLVRNLGSRGGRWFGVAGAAELLDGAVVLLLDLPRLVLGARRSK